MAWETRGQPILAASLAGAEGWRTFLTREGFQRLRDRDLTVVRLIEAVKRGDEDAERLVREALKALLRSKLV